MPNTNSQMQDIILGTLVSQKIPCTIFLVSGVQVRCVVQSVDDFCIFVETKGQTQMLYKHMVSTIVPLKAIDTNPDSKKTVRK